MDQFKALEIDILKWIASHAGLEALGPLLEVARVKEREYTVRGFFIDLALPESAVPLVPEELPRRYLDGPMIESPALEYAGGSLLFFEKGLPCLLELYAHGDVFPEELDEYTLVAPPKRAGQS